MKITCPGKAWTPTLALRRVGPLRLSAGRVNQRRRLVTLAIETSCDDTCVAVLEKNGPVARLLFNKRITSDNSAYGGIHPNKAVASHNISLAPLIREAIPYLPLGPASPDAPAGEQVRKPNFISVTRGPGMPPSLSTGLNTAKGLAIAWGVPLLGVNHMQAHALTPQLVSALANSSVETPEPISPAFPFLSLLVSGGHTILVRSLAPAHHIILAQAEHLAIGDLLDKVGRAIMPPTLLKVLAAGDSGPATVAYAALLERFAFPPPPPGSSDPVDYSWYTPPAKRVDEIAPYVAASGRWTLQAPLRGSRSMTYDFSTLHRDAQRLKNLFPISGGDLFPNQLDDSEIPEKELERRREIARATMKLAFEHLASRVIFALQDELPPNPHGKKGKERRIDRLITAPKPEGRTDTLVVAGGVASNRFLMHVLRSVLDVRGFGHVKIVSPPQALCTDNAAMIAWAGMEMYEAGWRTADEANVLRKWPIDPEYDGGIMGVNGWYRED